MDITGGNAYLASNLLQIAIHLLGSTRKKFQVVVSGTGQDLIICIWIIDAKPRAFTVCRRGGGAL